MPQQPPQIPEQSDRAGDGSSDLPARLRQDILSSWERSLLAGLIPERFEVPHVTEVDEDGPLAWVAAPVMAGLAEDLEGMGIGILLADSRGHIISRRSGERRVLRLFDKIELAPGSLYDEDHVGTNAIGTALWQARPSVVAGSEHFADALGQMACAASPITDAGGQLIGVLDLTCAARDFNPLMLSLAKRAVGEITAELAAGRLAVPRGSPALPVGAAQRARIFAAVDESRRRIERDLHDGAQQRLATLMIQLRAAASDASAGPGQLRDMLAQAANSVTAALDEVRDIARGIHPAVLSEGGLGSALRALARRSAVPVELTVPAGRLAERIEVTAYYVVCELLTNAVKYARASVVRVTVVQQGGTLHLSVRDDGVGGADPARGSGLVGLLDRVEAIGGTILIRSPAGAGTAVLVTLPLG